MRIKLVGALPRELRDFGLKPGDQFNAYPAQNSRLLAVVVKIIHDDEEKLATVFPENFKKM